MTDDPTQRGHLTLLPDHPMAEAIEYGRVMLRAAFWRGH